MAPQPSFTSTRPGRLRRGALSALACGGLLLAACGSPPTSEGSGSGRTVPDEGSVVTRSGMSYFHIPVDFAAPTVDDLRTFIGVMRALCVGLVVMAIAGALRGVGPATAGFIVLLMGHYERASIDAARDALAQLADTDGVVAVDVIDGCGRMLSPIRNGVRFGCGQVGEVFPGIPVVAGQAAKPDYGSS